ncbi:MAG TPA: cytochrome P450 [Pseudonocardiaceae bacterium]
MPTRTLADFPTAPGPLLDVLHELQKDAPVVWLPEFHSYLLTRRADVTALLKDRRLDSSIAEQSFTMLSPEQLVQLAPLRRCVSLWMGHTTTDGHRRFQMLLKRYFTPAAMENMRPNVRQIATDLIDKVIDAGQMEVVQDLAIPLPANVIADMLGMPVEDRPMLRVWSQSVVKVFQQTGFDDLLSAQEGVVEFQTYLQGLVDGRRGNLGEDLISELLRAEDEGQISTEEIVSNCLLILFAGHETTAGVITHGIALLLQNPDQLALLRDKPELGPSAVEEILRCEGTANTIVRDATEPFEHEGHQFEKGDRLFVSLYGANHDAEFIDDPDRFDITRPRTVHVAFGTGIFYCLGASLARVETDECLKVFLERIPNAQLAGEPVWGMSPPAGHRVESLPISW